MRRAALLALVTVAILIPSVPARADWGWHEFWHSICTDFKRNNCWPEPFVQADRVAVRAPLEIAANNGWRLQNTLSDHHFDVETHQLTQAGKLKVHSILTDSPPHRRSVWVLVGPSANSTVKRVDSVQQTVAQMIPQGPMPPVLQSTENPPTWTAERIDVISRKAVTAQPAPILPPKPGEVQQ